MLILQLLFILYFEQVLHIYVYTIFVYTINVYTFRSTYVLNLHYQHRIFIFVSILPIILIWLKVSHFLLGRQLHYFISKNSHATQCYVEPCWSLRHKGTLWTLTLMKANSSILFFKIYFFTWLFLSWGSCNIWTFLLTMIQSIKILISFSLTKISMF